MDYWKSFFELIIDNGEMFVKGVSINFESLTNLKAINHKKNILHSMITDWQLPSDRHEFEQLMAVKFQYLITEQLKLQWLYQYQKHQDNSNFSQTVNRHQNLVNTTEINAENKQNIAQFREDWEMFRLENEEEFINQLLKETQKKEAELRQYSQEITNIISHTYLQNLLCSAHYHNLLENHPLHSLSTSTLDFYQNIDQQQISPLLVMIFPPHLEGEQKKYAAKCWEKITHKLNEYLQEFVNTHYNSSSENRAIKILILEQEKYQLDNGSAMDILHYTHKAVPTMILSSKITGDVINIYLGFWDKLSPLYQYTKIASIQWQKLLYPQARENAKSWKDAKNKLLELGKNPQEIEQMGGENEHNLKILELEEINKKFSLNNPINYYVNGDEYSQKLGELFTNIHKLVLGLVTDQYYLYTGHLTPTLINLLPQILPIIHDKSSTEKLIKHIYNIYSHTYTLIKEFTPNQMLELNLAFVSNLLQLDDLSLAREQINKALADWLELQNIYTDKNTDKNKLIEILSQKIRESSGKLSDHLLESINNYLEKLGEEKIAVVNEKKYLDLDAEPTLIIHAPNKEKNRGNYPEDLRVKINLQPSEQKISVVPDFFNQLLSGQKNNLLIYEQLKFQIVTVNEWGQKISSFVKLASQIREKIADNVSLEMLLIPEGTFTMGSDNSDSERPPHVAEMSSFYISKYPITQEQWEIIARLPEIDISLNLNPSYFKGAKRPVEQISWDEAAEFCARLSKKTGKKYRLPSEAQWEYACKAGTNTPFYFGPTITTELVNYDGNFVYGSAPEGIYRQETTEVGKFPANAFGLYDTHGNVWEWCADIWHSNYHGAPNDGRIWLENGDDEYRVIRGGSWENIPEDCRGTTRIKILHALRDWSIGFRVVCEQD
jgi:formylglycine-generating enzyme required for sulfatase activity